MTTLQDSASPQAPREEAMPKAERVAAAATEWSDALASLGGRDPLLHFRDLKVGTLDLAAADAESRKKLLAGEPVLVSRLFPHEPLRSSALRSARAIRDKSRELAQERGIDTAMLAVGIATWANPFAAHRPTAPVLLRAATVTARDPAETDFVIEVVAEPVVNPVLLHALDEQLGLRFSPKSLRDLTGTLRYPVVIERLREFAPAHVVDGFSISHRAVLGTFAAEPRLAGADVEALASDLARHDVIAALAGDAGAARAVRGHEVSVAAPEYLVLEADAAQADVVAAAASGRHLRVQAPPGTGRTQTVTNLVAELVGQGQRVLVVANKRATLADLSCRLSTAGLDEVVADLSVSRPAAEIVADVVERVKALDATSPAATPGEAVEAASGRGARSTAARPRPDPLADYLEALHRRRDPWGCSAYDVMAAVAGADGDARTEVRLPGDTLAGLGTGRREALRLKLRQYTELGGLIVDRRPSPWSSADVTTVEAAEGLREAVATLRTTALPELRNAATRAAVEVGLVGPHSPREAFEIVELLTAVNTTMAEFRPELWAAPLDEYVAATAGRGSSADTEGRPGLLARRRLRLQIRDLQKTPTGRRARGQVHAQLTEARRQLAEWRDKARDPRPPRTGPHLPAASKAVVVVRRLLEAIESANPRAGALADLSFVDLAVRLAELAEDVSVLMSLPRLAELRADLEAAGLTEVMSVLGNAHADADRAEAMFAYTWQASLLDHLRETDPALGSVSSSVQDRAIAEFREHDAASLAGAAAQVLAEHKARFAKIREVYEGQVAVVLESAKTGTGPVTARDLVAAAPDVALAAAPCWIMPPLRVAETLAPRRLFDVVVVEDAGTLSPAEAIPALARADRVVLVGDSEQIVLAPFSTTVEQVTEQDDQPLQFAEQSSAQPESVLEALAEVLPELRLTTGYRFRDDRLVAYAAAGPYRDRYRVPPGIGGPSRLHHELVTADSVERADSSAAEVDRVVALILEHARIRPHESLGVVTLSRPHAARVESALRAALIRSPDVAPVLREDREEPFFVKDVEQVTGDVRDAIILTLGYGRSVDGRVLYRFGALDRPGGDRRLVAATTRARERITVVSSFGADDLSPRRLTTDGGRALRELLAIAEQEPPRGAGPGGDALAATLAERLRSAGASVEVGYGSGLGRIDVAVRHPLRRDRFILAVLTDGPAYAAAASVRERDLIRPDLLARLGWSVHRVWSAAWITDPDGENARLVDAYARAVADADAYDWAIAAAEADVVAGMPDDDVPESPGAESRATSGTDDDAAESTDETDDGAPRPAERGPRPSLRGGRPISAYTHRELAALARWVESDGIHRTEDEAIAELQSELRPTHDGPRTVDALRHALRVARAGAPGL